MNIKAELKSDREKVIRVRERQDPLRKLYKETPSEAWITDRARTFGGVNTDPFHGNVKPGSQDYGIIWPFGIHRAVGGDHDAPNPGDMLCAALAACLDSSIRMVADHLGVILTSLEVDVMAEVDVRGCLAVDRNVPVGFQKMQCRVKIKVDEHTDAKLVNMLYAASEYSCVNLNTLRTGVNVETTFIAGES